MTTASATPPWDSSSPKSSWDSVRCAKSRSVGSFWHDFDLSPTEQSFVHSERSFDEIFWAKLNVCKSFRMSIHLVTQDCDSVDASATVKMSFQFFSRCAVVYVTHVDRSVVNFHFLFYRQSRRRRRTSHDHLLVHFGLQLLQFFSFYNGKKSTMVLFHPETT